MIDTILEQVKDCIPEIGAIWPRKQGKDPFIFQIESLSKAGKLPKLARLETFLWENGLRTYDKARQKPGLIVPTVMINPAFALIQSIVEETGGLDSNSPLIKTIVQNYVESLSSQEAEYISIAPILGFQSSMYSISLWREFSIRKMTEAEWLRCKRIFGRFENIDKDVFILAKAPFHWQLDSDPGGVQMSSEFERILKFLRLIKGGFIDIHNIYTFCIKPGWISSPPMTFGLRVARPEYFPSASYVFEASDTNVLEILDNSEPLYINDNRDFAGRLKIAIARIQRTNQRLSPDSDDIIDLMIALEALLGEKGEAIAYKLGMRAAKLCGKDAADRQRIYKGVKSAYNKRSNIVHGNTKQTELANHLEFSHQISRAVLIEFLKGLMAGKIWTLEALDEHILN
ncbi:HEPN domain-containing protein [Turneriella parva]|uniref:Uncharacterized protein n=1 Tax=Turneriella parva (strain ATCC BAA-1111 / DSM 21527 / NCTC 11395 / H) TaxID=869212 RepID=I4B9S0_TURPD|nr:HEPN domain-containing protein [Turneriella parva]AFM14027.1 hypothetical protein Turpa_3389 [Turneriella parva DSM 21527]